MSVKAVIISLVLLSGAAEAQKSSAGHTLLSSDDLNLSGIDDRWAETFYNIYLGKLHSRTDETNDTERGVLLTSYVLAYGPSCPAYIPSDGLTLSETACSTDLITQHRFYTTTDCIRWEKIPTAYRADRNLSSLRPPLDAALDRDWAQTTPSDLLNGYTVYAWAARARKATDKLLQGNACDSPALRRYQDNLVRLIVGAEPLRLTDPAYKPEMNLAISPPLPIATGPKKAVVATASLPVWYQTKQKETADNLFPGDQAKFADITNDLASDVSSKDWASGFEEVVKLRALSKAYGERCYNVGATKTPHDDSGCNGKHAVEQFADQAYWFMYEKKNPK